MLCPLYSNLGASLLGPRGCEAVGLSLTSQLVEGGDESASEGLQLIIC